MSREAVVSRLRVLLQNNELEEHLQRVSIIIIHMHSPHINFKKLHSHPFFTPFFQLSLNESRTLWLYKLYIDSINERNSSSLRHKHIIYGRLQYERIALLFIIKMSYV